MSCAFDGGDMRSLSVRVEDDVKERLERLARVHGLNVSHVLREAIGERVEELEDFYAVSERLARPHRRVPDAEVWAELGRAD
jgi:predicted DNA-binding protein